jgi:hypothetical protein
MSIEENRVTTRTNMEGDPDDLIDELFIEEYSVQPILPSDEYMGEMDDEEEDAALTVPEPSTRTEQATSFLTTLPRRPIFGVSLLVLAAITGAAWLALRMKPKPAQGLSRILRTVRLA